MFLLAMEKISIYGREDWESTAVELRETAKKVFPVSSGQRKEDKET